MARLFSFFQRSSEEASVSSVEEDLDILGKLPGHIHDEILSRLPIKDAVRTSILSRKWRYKWANIPHLIIDTETLTYFPRDSSTSTRVVVDFVDIIDRVLLLHEGPIRKFKFSHVDFPGAADIDRWILHLSRKEMMEFTLEVWNGQRYRVPSSLFACKNLVHLELFNCRMKVPSTFEGFMSLKTLDLQWVTVPKTALEKLIFSCPLLERLTMVNLDGFSDLKIDSQTLKYLHVRGRFKDLDIVNTSSLSELSIGIYLNHKAWTRRRRTINRCTFSLYLPQVETLELHGYSLKYLVAFTETPFLKNVRLSDLSLQINLNDVHQILVSLFIFGVSPNLQKLEVVCSGEVPTGRITSDGGELITNFNHTFSNLQVVKIGSVSGRKSEMDLISFLLRASPVLKKMTIEPAVNCRKNIMEDLLRLRRVSDDAQIIYVGQ